MSAPPDDRAAHITFSGGEGITVAVVGPRRRLGPGAMRRIAPTTCRAGIFVAARIVTLNPSSIPTPLIDLSPNPEHGRARFLASLS